MVRGLFLIAWGAGLLVMTPVALRSTRLPPEPPEPLTFRYQWLRSQHGPNRWIAVVVGVVFSVWLIGSGLWEVGHALMT